MEREKIASARDNNNAHGRKDDIYFRCGCCMGLVASATKMTATSSEHLIIIQLNAFSNHTFISDQAETYRTYHTPHISFLNLFFPCLLSFYQGEEI